MSDSKEKKSMKKKTRTDEARMEKPSTAEFTTAAIGIALKKMDPELARQVVISAVSQNGTVFASAFSTACELMWVHDLLKVIDKPAELRKAGYSAKDVCLLVTERGYFVDKEILQKAKEIDLLHKLDTYAGSNLATDTLADLDKDKSSS